MALNAIPGFAFTVVMALPMLRRMTRTTAFAASCYPGTSQDMPGQMQV